MYNSLPVSLPSQRYEYCYFSTLMQNPTSPKHNYAKRLIMYPNNRQTQQPKIPNSSWSPTPHSHTAPSAPTQHQPAIASSLTACLAGASHAAPHWTLCSASQLSGGTGCILDLQRSSPHRKRKKSASWVPCNLLCRRLCSQSYPSCLGGLRGLGG